MKRVILDVEEDFEKTDDVEPESAPKNADQHEGGGRRSGLFWMMTRTLRKSRIFTPMRTSRKMIQLAFTAMNYLANLGQKNIG